jgi:Coenzyme PQQ synthesis protein D (PqqD).
LPEGGKMIIQKIDLSLSEYLRLAPVYNKKWIKYQRTGRNGYVSLMIPAGRYPRYEVLNATTINILQLMTGNNTIGNIIDTLCEKYGIDLKDKIVSDLDPLFRIFGN